MFDTILFDLDGTLTDSGEGIINSVIPALEHYGLPIPDRQTLRVFVGPPLHDMFVEFGVPADKADEAVEIFRARYNTIGKFENTPYPGIREMLAHLKSNGFSLLIATSKPERTAIEVLEHFDLAKYFDKICGASLDRSRDKKEQVIAYLLEQSRGAQMVMVGDTAFDVIGAAAHNIPCIGVAWGYGKTEDMVQAGAAFIADSVADLQYILENQI